MKTLLYDPVPDILTPEGMVRFYDDALARAKGIAEQIRSLKDVPDDVLTWDATFGAFDRLTQAVQEALYLPELFSVAHPDTAVREVAQGAQPKADAFISALYMDDAIAEVLKRAEHLLTETGSHARLIAEVLREYRRNGLSLPPEKRERLRELNEAITKLTQAFSTNLAETTLSLEVAPDQLAGLPESFIANHPVQENGRVYLTTDYPDLIPFLQYAKDRPVARALYTLSENRAAEKNLPLLQEILNLRHEKALLLGYKTWADYVLEPRMAKNAATVKTFLDKLHRGLVSLREKEVEILEEMQQKLFPEASKEIFVSDIKYIEDQVRRERFQLDTQRLSEYFEGSTVKRGIMDIASKLYGIVFVPAQVPTWHEDVEVYEVKQGGEQIGRVYLDLYPREGKYKHAAVFAMVETVLLPDDTRRLPIGALVCNFPKPGVSPALMSHEDVVTFFHEFGHLLHHVLSEADLASFAGTNVARDFVEAPSQMFEAWAWERETLDLFAKHYVTGERLPDDFFTAMTAARKFGVAIFTERQLFLAAYDHVCHTRIPGFDAEELVKEIYPQYSAFIRIPETHFPATFGHLMGYDAAYYGYQWALAIAFDLLTRFKKEGLMNKETASQYRKTILSRGGSEDETVMVENFLGRPSTIDAYLEYLGVRRDVL